MYSQVLGRAMNYGQSMIPGKSASTPNKKRQLQQAVLNKKAAKGKRRRTTPAAY